MKDVQIEVDVDVDEVMCAMDDEDKKELGVELLEGGLLGPMFEVMAGYGEDDFERFLMDYDEDVIKDLMNRLTTYYAKDDTDGD